MDLATVVGFALCSALMFITMLIAAGDSSVLMFWDLTSIIVVLGGAITATLVQWPLNNFLGGSGAIMAAIIKGTRDPKEIIDVTVELADTARKGSILALEKVTVEDPFMAKAVKMMVDGLDPEVINNMIDIEIENTEQRHKDGRGILENMADLCPAFGMIGTVIGLVVIMGNLTDMDALGKGLQVALLTTLYGAGMANVVFIPLAGKLKFRASEETTNMEITKEGVNSILRGENPRAIREKLESFMAPKDRTPGEE